MSDELGGGGGYEAGSVYIGIEADTSPLDNLPEQIAAKISGIGAISVPFDHEPLRAGNAHIESKFEHVIDVNRRLAQNAIKPLYDGSSVRQLSSDLRSLQAQIDLVQTKIQLEATLNADAVRSQLDEIASQPRVIRYVTEVQGPDPQSIYGTGQPKAQAKPSVEGLGDAIAPELKKAFKDASKEFNKGNIFGGIASFVTAPLRAVGSLATDAIGGAVFGAGQQLTSGFAKGLTNSLSGKLAGSIGSPELLGEKSGDLIANFAGFARKSIVNKAKAANVAIDKAIEVGTLEFGNFSIPLDILGINKADLRTFKEELTTAVRTSVEEYLEEFEQIFPEVQRQAEAAAQRNKVRRRRQSVEKAAPQQIIDENQETIQQLTRQRARGNVILNNKSAEAEAIRDEVRVNRREAAQILKQIIRAETNGEIREQLIRLAAEDIPARFQGQINKLQRAYGETIEKINQKNAEIARDESESALLGIKPNPEIKSQRLDDIQRLRAQAEKQQQDIRLQESIVQQEVEQYLSAATGEIDFAPILADLKNQAIEQIKSLGEPLLQVQKEKAEIEQALRSVNAEISRLADSSFAASSPQGRRLVLQRTLGKQQTNLSSVQSEIADTQSVNELLLNKDSFSAKDADLFKRNVLKISELEKKQQRIQRQIAKTQTDLGSIPGSGDKEVRQIFKEIFSELGVKGKEPEVIVDTVAATQKNANAYYDPTANAVIIKAELNDAIKRGGLTDKQKGTLREEIIHSVQFGGGSAEAFQNFAESQLDGSQQRPVVQASVPTPAEVRRLSKEIQFYQSSGRGQQITVELEAKVLRDRLAAREKEQATINRITQELNTKAGFSGAALDSAYTKYLSQFLSEVKAIKQIEGIDASEPISRYIDIVSVLSDSSKQYLEQLARLNLGQVDAAEAIQIESSFDKQVEDISNIYKAKESLVQEIQQLTQRKSESLVFPDRADAELVPVQRQERQTVGGAISAVASGVVVPAAQRAGDAVVAVGKAGIRVASAIEAIALDLIPGGQSLKATTRYLAKNVGLPTGAAIAASQIPAIGGLEQVAIHAAGDLVHQLVGLTRTGILSQVQSIISAAIPSFIPGSQNIVSIVSERIAALATGALDATGTATAEGLATVLSGSAVLNVLKKGVNTGIAQASRALPAAGQAILDTPQAQAISKAQIPFELPTRDRVLEVAEDLGAAARAAEDKTIQFAENALKGLRLLTAQIPEGRELIDLGLDELQAIKRKLAARFDEVAQAEREGKPVLAGRDVVRGDIKRVQRVIDAKSQPIAEVPQAIQSPAKSENQFQPIAPKIEGLKSFPREGISSFNAALFNRAEKIQTEIRAQLQNYKKALAQGRIEEANAFLKTIKSVLPSATKDIETINSQVQDSNLDPITAKGISAKIRGIKKTLSTAEQIVEKQIQNIDNALRADIDDLGILKRIDLSSIDNGFSDSFEVAINEIGSAIANVIEAAVTELLNFADEVNKYRNAAVKEVGVDSLNLDPKRFQYKLASSPTGATGSLSGVERFDQNLAGVVQVWRDPANGKDYVINGHNRVTLAKDLGVENLAVRYINAKTAEEARAIGAKTNIAEGRGNPLDAAKFFRDSNITSQKQLKELGIPLRESIATQGLGLAKLAPDLFDKTVLGAIPLQRASLIGENLDKPEDQRALIDLLEKEIKKGRKITNDSIKELIDIVKSSNSQTEQQVSLFGTEDVSKNLAVEKAQLQSSIRTTLGKDSRLFGTVAKQSSASALERGGNVIDVQQSSAIAQQSITALKVFDELKNRAGQISDIINKGAQRISAGEKVKTVEKEVLSEILTAVESELSRFNQLGKSAGNDLSEGFQEGLLFSIDASSLESQLRAAVSDALQSVALFGNENIAPIVNKLFEVEGKNLEDALKKAAVSPRAKDLYVNTAGFAASQVGAQLGPVPQLAGDLGGALVARQAINIGEQAIAARSELLEDELYQSANAIKKLKMVAQKTAEKLQSVELQKILGSNLSEDVTGFSIGNIAAALGQGAVPGVGAAAAMATVPKLSELRKYINERITASQGDGEEDLGILKSISNGPLYSNKDIEVLKRLADELAEIERLTKQIELGQERIRKIEADTTKLEQINRRNLRFDTVGQDQNQRAAAQEVERMKARNKAEADAEKARRDRLTQSDISTVLSNAKPRTQPDRLAQARLENERENAGRTQSSRTRQDSPIDRLTEIKAETEAQQESLTSRLESINARRAAERNATNERLAEIKAEAEAQKQLQQDRLVQSLESQRNQGIRERLTASQQPKPKEDLAQYLTRVPGTAGGGNGPRVPGPPTLFIPEITPRFEAFELAKRAASGFLGIVEKIPAPIKNLFFLLGGGFAGFQAFQILTSQANKSYEAIKRLQSTETVVRAITGNTNTLDFAEREANRLGTNRLEGREGAKKLSIQAENTPIEGKTDKIFAGTNTAIAALKLGTEEQQRFYRAINQVAGKGTVQAEEVVQQLGELGISVTLQARALGLTVQQFKKQLESGTVLSPDYLDKVSAQFQLEFGGAALAAGDSLQGLENRVINASSKLQENLGKESLPLATAGLKVLNSVLEFAANNVSTLTNLIQIGLVASLLKGVTALGKFALAEQAVALTNSQGRVIGSVGVPRIGLAAQGAKDFFQKGGIQRVLQSEAAQDIKALGAQALVVGAGIGAFQKIAENFTGGEALQAYNKQLEITKERLAEINKVEGKASNSLDNLDKRFEAGVKNVQSFVGNLLSLNFAGAFDNIANGFILGTGGDPNAALSEGFLANRKQADNRAIINSALDEIESKDFQSKFNEGIKLANQIKSGQPIDKEQIKKVREDLQTRKEKLQASIADPKLKATEQGKQIESDIKSLEKLIQTLGGTGGAYVQLSLAVQKFNEVTKNQIELSKLQESGKLSKQRAQGSITEFDQKTQEAQLQINASQQLRANLAQQIALSDKFLASNDFALLNDPKNGDPQTALKIQQQNLELKTQYAQADKQIDDQITQNRLEAINRRSELLQREVAEQERAIAKLESLRKIRTTKRDAGLAEGVANQSLTPQALRLQQPINAVGDAQDEIVEQEKKRQNALKNLKKARADLSQINPNDEQQFEQGKAAVAQYEQAVLAAEAEINTQRKAGAEAATQYRSEIEDQIRTQIDLTVRKNEQAVAKEIQGIDRLGNAQKRRIDDAVAGYQREQKSIDFIITTLDRAAKISNKRAELNSAINQGRQIPLAGLAGEIRDAEGLIAKLKDKNLDPGVRGRTLGVLNQLGIGNNEQDAFRYRVKIEDQIAKLKADALSAEIEQSQITLDIEERKETFAAKRAIIEAEITKQQAEQAALAAQIERRKAESESRKTDIGVQKASAQLQLAQLSGDPNKVREAELNLEDAKLSQSAAQDTLLGAKQSEKLAREALPNATLSVVDALENFAATIETGKLSRRILAATNQNKVSQFNTEERGRVRGLAIEGIDKGVEVNIATGGANGFDPFGFRASRAKDEMARQEERRRFQNGLRGIPNESEQSNAVLGFNQFGSLSNQGRQNFAKKLGEARQQTTKTKDGIESVDLQKQLSLLKETTDKDPVTFLLGNQVSLTDATNKLLSSLIDATKDNKPLPFPSFAAQAKDPISSSARRNPQFTNNSTGVNTYAPDLSRLNLDYSSLQNNIKGLPDGALPSRGLSSSVAGLSAPAYKAQELKPLEIGALGKSDQQAMQKATDTSAMPSDMEAVTTLLSQLVTIEERLSAQILTLAGRQQVQISNTANYAVREPILSDTNL